MPSEIETHCQLLIHFLNFQEKFKKEFKQRFSFGPKHNRFANDSFEVSYFFFSNELIFIYQIILIKIDIHFILLSLKKYMAATIQFII